MSPAGRKTPPDQMADRLWRLVGRKLCEEGPYLPTEDGYRAITEWFLREEWVRPDLIRKSRVRPARTPPAPGRRQPTPQTEETLPKPIQNPRIIKME